MPCSKCRSDFNLLNWKIKCGECEDKYCNKCLKRREGVLYCEKCLILLKRPPDRLMLMELKSKDLQDYLNKRNISTYGLIEKHELVDLFYDRHIPVKPKRGVEKLTANFAGSVPNLKPINDFFGNLDSVINNGSRPTRSSRPEPRQSPSSKPQASFPTQQPPGGSHLPEFTTQATAQNTENNPQPQATTSTVYTESPEDTQPKKEEENSSDSPVQPRYPKIDDFNSVEELQNLSPKDLKILLTLYRIDFKGCVEKQELLDRAKRLWEDNNEQKKGMTENMPTQDLCKLCMDAPLDCVLLQCGHMATCIECGKKLAECPICRQYIARVVRTFKA